MKVYELLELCSENTEIVIWDCISGNIIEHYDNIYCVKCYWNDYEIKEICGGIFDSTKRVAKVVGIPIRD
jgi:hypothetical protein